jgi:hypothetical protein
MIVQNSLVSCKSYILIEPPGNPEFTENRSSRGVNFPFIPSPDEVSSFDLIEDPLLCVFIIPSQPIDFYYNVDEDSL